MYYLVFAAVVVVAYFSIWFTVRAYMINKTSKLMMYAFSIYKETNNLSDVMCMRLVEASVSLYIRYGLSIPPGIGIPTDELIEAVEKDKLTISIARDAALYYMERIVEILKMAEIMA